MQRTEGRTKRKYSSKPTVQTKRDARHKPQGKIPFRPADNSPSRRHWRAIPHSKRLRLYSSPSYYTLFLQKIKGAEKFWKGICGNPFLKKSGFRTFRKNFLKKIIAVHPSAYQKPLKEVFEKGDERDRRRWRKQEAGGVAAVEVLGAAERDLKISGTATGKGKTFCLKSFPRIFSLTPSQLRFSLPPRRRPWRRRERRADRARSG